VSDAPISLAGGRNSVANPLRHAEAVPIGLGECTIPAHSRNIAKIERVTGGVG
jgi:hypothetical protein